MRLSNAFSPSALQPRGNVPLPWHHTFQCWATRIHPSAAESPALYTQVSFLSCLVLCLCAVGWTRLMEEVCSSDRENRRQSMNKSLCPAFRVAAGSCWRTMLPFRRGYDVFSSLCIKRADHCLCSEVERTKWNNTYLFSTTPRKREVLKRNISSSRKKEKKI